MESESYVTLFPVMKPFSSVKKAKNLVFPTEVSCKKEEALGMSMEMTLSITKN